MVIVKFISMLYLLCNWISAINYDKNYSMLNNYIVNYALGFPIVRFNGVLLFWTL